MMIGEPVMTTTKQRRKIEKSKNKRTDDTKKNKKYQREKAMTTNQSLR